MKTFKNFIAPLTIEEFLTDYWQSTPLFINNKDNTQNIISLKEIDNFLSSQPLTYPSVRVIGNGIALEMGEYKHNQKGGFSYLNRETVFKLYAEGNTIVIQGASFLFKNLGKFVENLKKETGIQIHPNIYITPSNSKGFNPHFDTHEVFVYQVDGSKNWNLYNAPVKSPIGDWHLTQKQIKEYLAAKPTHKIVLNKGDLLYLPRGVVHDAFTSDKPSIHITFGFHPILKVDILKKLLSVSKKSSFFRESYFPGFTLTDQENREGTIHEITHLLNQVIEEASIGPDYIRNNHTTEEMFGSIYSIDKQKSTDRLVNLNSRIKDGQ